MVELYAYCGTAFLISDEDYAEISQSKWYISNKGYVQRGYKKQGEETLLSRYIMKNIRKLDIENLIIDHIDRNPLNNKRSNLRSVDSAENIRNTPKRNDCTSMYKGLVNC